ncbi:EAL domain-containing protein [Siminovitchia sediminis]|uniref:EAL domain-containing protein n=1 Tax=Siminovitchia sediminis TaxID=1274353 RepID=A0ABW4KE52_9BACI
MSHELSAISGTNYLMSYMRYLNNRIKKESLYHKRFRKMQQIIQQQSLDTYFQPIIHLKNGETIGYEVFNRPEQSKLFPNTEIFYDFVGQTDQAFIFDYFCRNISIQRFVIRAPQEKVESGVLLFINIHPHVLLDSNYHSGETLSLLQEFGLDPKNVVLELTEKSAVTDFVQFEKVLSNYRAQGYRIAVDDVGSGYNSLKTLVYLKPEFIKLDRSLIQYIDQNVEQQELVSLIMGFAEKTGTRIIAEGVERAEELEYIRNQGADYAQGYAIGRPKQEIDPGRIPEMV